MTARLAAALAAIALCGASAASAADLRMPVHRVAVHARHHAVHVRRVVLREACPPGRIDDRGYIFDWRAYHLQPPPRGYCWLHKGDEIRLEALASGRIAEIYKAF